jgi:CBS domain-containing protein
MDARDIMTKGVIAVAPDMFVGEAADLLMRYRIHGAPVVDAGDQLIGMISFMDLAGRPGEKVRDVMAPDPVSASEDTPVDELAALMLDQMVRRIPIVSGGRVVGIVSASDVIQVFLNLHESQGARAEVQEEREVVRSKAGRR